MSSNGVEECGVAGRRSRAAPGDGGFTLVEVLISLVVLSLVMVAVLAVGFTLVTRVNDDSVERQKDATTAQWSAMAFARDVQGAAGVADGGCGSAPDRTRLVTLVQSDSDGSVVYWRTNTAPFQLIRVECPGGEERVVVRDLDICPSVEYDSTPPPGGCPGAPSDPGTPPRRVALRVSRTSTFGFELDGARRLTDGNSTAAPLEVPSFVSIGGGTPLRVTGNSELHVVGNALINRPATGTVAVNINGSARLDVSGTFELQAGGTCPNCAGRANKLPGSFAQRLADPLRFLPAPDTSTLAVRTSCPVQSGKRVCQPGIYQTDFPPTGGGGGGGVKDFELCPGVYVIRAGMKVTNGSIVNWTSASDPTRQRCNPPATWPSGVLLYNELGEVDVTGADIDLAPASTGIYAGILYFQARGNAADFKLSGNSVVASLEAPDALAGTIYVPAPTAAGVVLGGGGGTLRVGRVVGSSLETFGNGTVIVDGS